MAVTKQQLQQQIEALRAENAALRSAVPPKQRPKFIVSPEEEARRARISAAMAAAKAEAIRTGRTVKVQF